MASSFKGILFDLDGVLCHTDMYHIEAWKKISRAHGIPFEDETYDYLRGVSRRHCLEIILRVFGVEMRESEKERFLEEKNNLYIEYLKTMGSEGLTPGAVEVLEELRKKYRLALCSSSRNAKLIIKQLGIEHFFDAVSDGTMIMNAKPDPELFLLGARLLHLSPEECLVIEDAESGIEAAVRGGFKNAGIGPAAKLERIDYKLDKLTDLLSFL